MPPVTLLLALHNHQPDGNFDEVFAAAYADCYVRILDALEEAPAVRLALHHTGALLYWIEQQHPDYIQRIRTMVERGQVEILGGGFYEPMLAVLPQRDALGQIAQMGDFCAARFGVRPTGMWLAERVWEPGLPEVISSAGIRYTLIDDNHFRSAGMSGPLRGYYVTEKAGAPLAIFPIEQKLRYAIPFELPEQALKTILGLAEETPERECIVTYGDDGEKFGVWPGTKEWVWDKGWLRSFFKLLTAHRDRIQTAHPGEIVATRRPSGRVYLPTASYEEMGEWALPAQAQTTYHELRHRLGDRDELEVARPYLRGGIWQGFLAKYPEANWMHKKMIQVSDKVAQAVAVHPERENENRQMHDELYRAQCNCSYWHGLFGGLYLNSLRDTVYRHLLVAEAFADAQLGRAAPAWAPNVLATVAEHVHVEERDIDADMVPEVIVQSAVYDVCLRLHDGAALQEIALRPKTFMLTNVLGRHEEGYHHTLRKHLEAERKQKLAAERKAQAARTGAAETAGPDNALESEEDAADKPKSIHDLVKVKEPDLDKYLFYDTYPRYCFVDHFLGMDADLDHFTRGEEAELGDFVGGTYQWLNRGAVLADTGQGGAKVLHLERVGLVAGKRVRLCKSYTIVGATLGVTYHLELVDPASAPLSVHFAPEVSFTLLDGNSGERTYHVPGRVLDPAQAVLSSRGVLNSVAGLSLCNQANRFRIDFAFGSARPTLWRFPLETVSMSESGFERTYQGSVLLCLFPLQLTPDNRTASFKVELTLVDL